MLANLREKTLGARTVAIDYDSNNRVDDVTDSANPYRAFTHDMRRARRRARKMQPVVIEKENGVPGEIRTHGPQIRNLVLYPAELRGQERRKP